MIVSWARAIMNEHFQKGLDFSREALLLYIIFPKINRKPNNSKTEGRKGHTGPPGQPRGEELPCRFFSLPVTLSPGQPRGEELPCKFLSHPVTLSSGQPRGEELPCRFLCRPGGSRGDILGPWGSPVWGRAVLQVPLLSRDLVTDWAHPGGSRHISVIVYALLELLFMETLKFSPFCHFCLSKYYPEISRQTCFLKCLHWTESVWIFIS